MAVGIASLAAAAAVAGLSIALYADLYRDVGKEERGGGAGAGAINHTLGRSHRKEVRALAKEVAVGKAVPVKWYQPVAEVLAYVYKLKKAG